MHNKNFQNPDSGHVVKMCKESTQLALSWDNFQTNLQDTWRHLHQTEDFADVILACDVGQVLSTLDYLMQIILR